jgi:hypothetical protein
MTAAQVVQLLADAINANANLQALGVTAFAVGGRVVTTGDITSVSVGASGLSDVLELTVLPTRLWWGNVRAATGGYDVVRGDIGELRTASGNYSSVSQSCLADDESETYVEHASDVPAPGQGYWYLLRSEPGGSYDSGGSGQVGSRDPGVTGCP